MKHLHKVYENNYMSNDNFSAEDSKPFEFAVCIEITDLNSACGDIGFLISVSAAKLPKYLTYKQRKQVAECNGIKVNEVTVVDVSVYGLSAPLDSYNVATWKDVESKLSEIDNKIPVYGMLCGFYFDKQVNMIGNTGWQSLTGDIGN